MSCSMKEGMMAATPTELELTDLADHCEELFARAVSDLGVPTLTPEERSSPRHRCRECATLGGRWPLLASKRRVNSGAHRLFALKWQNGIHEAHVSSLFSSQPWVCYWTLQAVALTGSPEVCLEKKTTLFEKLLLCQDPETTAFGGSPAQVSHLLPTYAAVAAAELVDGAGASKNGFGRKSALCKTPPLSDKTVAALRLSKPKILSWLRTLRDESSGGFRVHVGGEIDVRATFCAVYVARSLSIDVFAADDKAGAQGCGRFPEFERHSIFRGTPGYIGALQTYEGGLSGEPQLEAHGGYTYCGVMALLMLAEKCEALALTDGERSSQAATCAGEWNGNKGCDLKKLQFFLEGVLDVDALILWACNLQDKGTGGFAGRTGKLSDCCYAHWVGEMLHALQVLFRHPAPAYNRCALKSFLLHCCQGDGSNNPKRCGGMRDKPPAPPDPYHLCYGLLALESLDT